MRDPVRGGLLIGLYHMGPAQCTAAGHVEAAPLEDELNNGIKQI